MPPTPADAAAPRAAAFLQTVLRSGLLDSRQLDDALRDLAADKRGEARAVADHLVKTGKLTRFQASKLLEGAHVGLLLGPYQVLAPIGRGGMGTVYLARDQRNQQLLALKVLPPKRAREEDRMLARFQREMHVSQKVAHPNLTQTYEVGSHKGVHYIAMEYIPGKNLSRLVHEDGTLPVPRAARLFAEVAAGLHHAHGQGLIHRDLKPSNIIITPADRAKVLDLGLALMQDDLPADVTVTGGAGYVVGTMDYIAPEQTQDASKVDARSDVYALGCTLYFALTGQPPFPGGTSLQKIMRHRNDVPTPLGEFNPTVPIGFSQLVERMMAKRPERRFASAAAVREALLAWADQRPAVPDQVVAREFAREVDWLQGAEASPEQLRAAIVEPPADEAEPLDAELAEPVGWPPWVLLTAAGAAVVVILALWMAVLVWLRTY